VWNSQGFVDALPGERYDFRMLSLLFATTALAFSPHCEISGHYKAAKAPVALEVFALPGKPAKKIASGKTAADGSFKLRFWQSKTEGFEGFFVRALGKTPVDSPEVKFSIDPGDCSAKIDF
jgi:hypothetical protein